MSSRRKRAAAPPLPPPAAPAPYLWDVMLLGCLGLLAVFFLNLSWRKWPDPIVDFGRELYLPWRLTQGAVLYRDMQHVYGPFSQYFNSFVFRIAGVGLGSLITVNIIIYAAILGLLYYCLRAGWGRLAAFVSCVVFVSVFSFSHLVGIGNYNYITPYSHETTHSVLLILLLIGTLRGVLKTGARWQFLCAGLLAGTSVLIKPETMLAVGAVSFGAILLSARQRFRTIRGADWKTKLLLLLAGAIAPVALAILLFHWNTGLSWGETVRDVNAAWLNVLAFSSALSSPMQKASMGTDNIGGNLLNEAMYGGLAAAFAFGSAWGCGHFARQGQVAEGFWLLSLLAIGIVVAAYVPWLGMGTAIPGMLLCAAALEAKRLWRRPPDPVLDDETAVRVLLWLAGLAFLFRMILNPRIFHYGYFQAPLGMVVSVATLLVAVPDFFRVTGWARKLYQGGLAALIFWGCGVIASQSAHILSAQTLPVGMGDDQFLAFDPQKTGITSGALAEVARQYLATDTAAHSLLVMPEGIMLNYLTRLPSTVPNYLFDPGALAQGRGEKLLQQLKAAPPDRVVLISRDLREYGVMRFGDTPEHGQALIDFVHDNYNPVFMRGGDPLDVNQVGVAVYALRQDSPLFPRKP